MSALMVETRRDTYLTTGGDVEPSAVAEWGTAVGGIIDARTHGSAPSCA